MILFPGNSNLPLARKLAKNPNIKLGKIDIHKFSDGESYVNILENVKGKKVCVLQSGCNPANENLMELLLIIDALKKLGAVRVTAIIPFYPYRRQERRVEPGEPVAADLVAKFLQVSGTDKVVAVDLHSPAIKKFFKIPLVEIKAQPLFIDYFRKKNIKDLAVVTPDKGSQSRSAKVAEELKLPLIKIFKKRNAHDKAKAVKLEGEVKNKDVLIIEDEVNTAGTIADAVRLLKQKRCKDVYIAATHAVLSSPAIDRLKEMPVKEVIFTDSICLPKEKCLKNIKILSLVGLVKKEIINS